MYIEDLFYSVWSALQEGMKTSVLGIKMCHNGMCVAQWISTKKKFRLYYKQKIMKNILKGHVWMLKLKSMQIR